MKGRENSACSSLLSEGCVISSPNPDMTHYASKATVHTSHLDGMTKFVESSLEPCFGKLTCLTFCSFTHTFESNAEYAVYAYDWYIRIPIHCIISGLRGKLQKQPCSCEGVSALVVGSNA